MSDASNGGNTTDMYDDDFDWDQFFRDEHDAGSSPEAAADSAAESLQQPPAEPVSAGEHDLSPDPTVAPPPSPATEEPALAAAPSPPEAPSYVEVGGENIPQDQTHRVAAVYKWLNEYPDEAQKFVGYLQGDYEISPAQQQQEQPQQEQPQQEQWAPPAEEDWEFVPDSLRQRMGRVDQMEQRLEQYDQYFQQQQQAQAQDAIDRASSGFREAHDMTDEEFTQIRTQAGQMGIAGQLAMEHGGDMARGAQEAMEIAYLRNPAMRERENQAQMQQLAAEQQRQQRLSAIGGNGGSAPRTAPVPESGEDRRAAMVQELAAAIDNQRGN